MDPTTEYVFSINTGRSGSHYLATICEHIEGCRSFHEPDPVGNGDVMRRYARGDSGAMSRFTKEKFDAIQALKGDCRTYIETNQCFIKGFGWFLPEYIPEGKIGVVILKRDKSKIAESIQRIGSSPLNAKGRIWFSTPDMRSPLVAPPRRLLSPRATYVCARAANVLIRRMNWLTQKTDPNIRYPKWMLDYELECLKWYVDETYAKAEAFKQKYPRIRYFEAQVDDLNSMDSVRQMLALFGLREKETLKDVVGRPTNLKLPEPETSEQPAMAHHG